MAIGTALAIGLGSAVIGAGGSALAASKNSKAIKKASAAQQASTDQSTALQRDIYAQNKSALSPFMERGNAAGSTLNALLGVGGTQAAPQPNALSQFAGNGQTYGFEGLDGPQGRAFNFNEPDFGQGMPGAIGGFGGGTWNIDGTQATPVQPAPSVTPQAAALDAYNIFKQSTGYQDRLNEGYRALNARTSGAGGYHSGAAIKSGIKYGQNFASNEFGNYLGYLGNQQGVGLSGASALAGVGQSYANNIAALNQNQAQFSGQAAVARANNSNSLITGIGGAIGGALGSFGGGFGSGSSYSPTFYNPRTQF